MLFSAVAGPVQPPRTSAQVVAVCFPFVCSPEGDGPILVLSNPIVPLPQTASASSYSGKAARWRRCSLRSPVSGSTKDPRQESTAHRRPRQAAKPSTPTRDGLPAGPSTDDAATASPVDTGSSVPEQPPPLPPLPLPVLYTRATSPPCALPRGVLRVSLSASGGPSGRSSERSKNAFRALPSDHSPYLANSD